MAAIDYYTGDNVRIGVGINAEVAGMTFDEAVGTFDCMKIVSGGGCTIEHVSTPTEVDELDTDPTDVIFGGEIHKISCDVVMSYSGREKIFQLWAGGIVAPAGVGPYVHAMSVVKKLLNGGFFVEKSKQSAQANEYIRLTYANFVVGDIALSASPEGYATLSFSGIATGKARITNQASLTTVLDTEPLSWKHLEVSLNGTTTYCVGDVNFSLSAALAEGIFGHGCTTQNGNWRSGQKGVGWGMTVMQTDASYPLAEEPTGFWTGVNYLKWNNADTTPVTDEREFKITFGTSYHDGSISRSHGGWGRVPLPLSLKTLEGATARVAVEFTNARVTIPA